MLHPRPEDHAVTFAATRYHDFSYGHRVVGHENKCALMHGHNGRVYFRIEPAKLHKPLDDVGRVLDFSVIKTRLCDWLEENWDHKFLVWDRDPFVLAIRNATAEASGDALPGFMAMLNASFVWVPFNPTAENMAKYLVDVVGPLVLSDSLCVLTACEVQETRKCSATYFREG